VHRDQVRRGFPHAPDGIDRNGHRPNIAVRSLELYLQVRLAGNVDGVPILSCVQRSDKGQGHKLALVGVSADFLL